MGERAEYGKGLLKFLSENLTTEFGKGFTIRNLQTILNCFVVIDLKTGKLTHQDVGQIDFYVRYYNDKLKLPEHNPTIGILLCANKNETLAKYSVLADNEHLFASKYMLYLPTEDELKRERYLLEEKAGGEDEVYCS